MRVLFDHQIFSLQDAGGASRYFYELVRHLQGSDVVRLELGMGLSNSVFPFRAIANSRTRVFESRTQIPPGLFRYVVNRGIFQRFCYRTRSLRHLPSDPIQGDSMDSTPANGGYASRLYSRAFSSPFPQRGHGDTEQTTFVQCGGCNYLCF